MKKLTIGFDLGRMCKIIAALSILALSGCMDLARGYVRVTGVSDLRSAFNRAEDLIGQVGFVREQCHQNREGIEKECYSFYPPGYDASDNNARRAFFVELLGCQKNILNDDASTPQ